jgi:hypothetical protein
MLLMCDYVVNIFTKLCIYFFTFFRDYSQLLICTMRGRYEFILSAYSMPGSSVSWST